MKKFPGLVVVMLALGCAGAPKPVVQQAAPPPTPEEKIAAAKATQAQKPEDPDANNRLGLALAAGGKFAEAAQFFGRAVQLTEGMKTDPLYSTTTVCPDVVVARYLNLASATREAGDPHSSLQIMLQLVKRKDLGLSVYYEEWMETAEDALGAGEKLLAAEAMERAAGGYPIALVHAKGLGFDGGDYYQACRALIERVWNGADGYEVAGLRQGLHGYQRESDDAHLNLELAARAARLYLDLGDAARAHNLLAKAQSELKDRPGFGSPETADGAKLRPIAISLHELVAEAETRLAKQRDDEKQREEERRKAAAIQRMHSPDYWGEQLDDALSLVLEANERARAAIRGGYGTRVREELWPALIDAETKLCASIAEMKDAMGKGHVQSVVDAGYRRVALRSGDAEAGAFADLVKSYLKRPDGRCPMFSEHDPLASHPSHSSRSRRSR